MKHVRQTVQADDDEPDILAPLPLRKYSKVTSKCIEMP